MRERVRPLPEFVARVDNTASLVFAAGFVLAASTITSSVFLAAIVIPAWAVERAFGMSAVLWLLGAVLTPMLVVTLAVAVAEYRKRGATVDPQQHLRACRPGGAPAVRGAPARRRAIAEHGAHDQRRAPRRRLRDGGRALGRPRRRHAPRVRGGTCPARPTTASSTTTRRRP
jgi:hypothetical protein